MVLKGLHPSSSTRRGVTAFRIPIVSIEQKASRLDGYRSLLLSARCLWLIYRVAGPTSLKINTYSMSRLTSSPAFASKLLHSSKMPAFTLYGSRGSTNTDRVRLTLAEGGFTDYEFVLLNLQKGEQKVGNPFLLEDDAASPRMSKSISCRTSTFSSPSSNIFSLPATFDSCKR
jgi:hypothetical protein